jgi:hypothetical protein
MSELKNFQECADVEVINYYKESSTHLNDLIELQRKTQNMYAEKQGGKKFEDMNLQEIINFWFVNKHAIEDEFSEMIASVTGVHDGIPNLWKPWKSDTTKFKDKKFSELSERDQKECKMEIIDSFHFMINFWISVGGTAEELYNFYLGKNARNWTRQQNGY